MSVHFVFVRFVVENCHSSDLIGKEVYSYWKTMSVGWKQGARMRIRHFDSILKLVAYLDKLHIHKWISDSELERVNAHILELAARDYPSICG